LIRCKDELSKQIQVEIESMYRFIANILFRESGDRWYGADDG